MLKAVPLGRNCGLKVSQLCLGTMNFGEPGRGHQGDWTLGIDDARPLFKAALDHGLFYFVRPEQPLDPALTRVSSR